MISLFFYTNHLNIVDIYKMYNYNQDMIYTICIKRGGDIQMNLHEKIREIRIIRNTSQALMAENMGCTTGAYSHKETGKRNISADELQKIAAVLKVEPAIFFDDNLYKLFKKEFSLEYEDS